MGSALIPKSADINGRERVNDKGQTELFVKAGASLTAKTMYRLQLDEDGFEAVAISTGAVYYRVCIPEAAISSGASGWVVVMGLVEDAVIPSTDTTAGKAFKIHDGAITDMTAAWAFSDNELGVYAATSGGATTTCDLFLSGREALATTT
jgi:hypothetical protein